MKSTLMFSIAHSITSYILAYFILGILMAIIGSFRNIFLDQSVIFPFYVLALISILSIIIAIHSSLTYLTGRKISTESSSIHLSLYSAIFFTICNVFFLRVAPGSIPLQLVYILIFYSMTWFLVTKKRKSNPQINSLLHTDNATGTDSPILSLIKKYSTLKDVFFSVALLILVAGGSIFTAPHVSDFDGSILLVISVIVNLILFFIFIGASNTIFKNVTRSLKGYRLGVFAQETDIQTLQKKDIIKPVRFFTIPYILMTCIMLVTWFSDTLMNIGLTFVGSIDTYVSGGFLLPLLFQLLSFIWIPYSFFRIVIWMNGMFQKSNLKFAEKKGDISFDQNPEKFIAPSKTSLVILSVYLIVWGGCNLFIYLGM